MVKVASNDEQIGFHKGALTTLAKEREEMVKIIGIVEQLMQAHIKGLKDLGVDIEAEARKAQELLKKAKSPKKPGEDIADRLRSA
jgi:hypothetical protein